MKLLNIFLMSLLFAANALAETPILLLTERNTLVMRGVFDSQSVATAQANATALSQKLAKTEPIYLVLDTPGGDMQAGGELITTLRGLPQTVNTVTNFAASMGFITAQSLGTRYILPNGILMSHRARGGVSGQIPGELNVRADFFTKMIDEMDSAISKRVGLEKTAYQNLIRDEYWVYGEKAVRSKMADFVVLVRCDKSLTEGKIKETINTFFGPVRLTYSACPLISAPLEVTFAELDLSEYDARDKVTLSQVRETILSMVYDKKNFYKNYMLTDKYKKVIP